MKKNGSIWLAASVLACTLGACSTTSTQPPSAHYVGASLRYIGEQRLASHLPFKGTIVGGLSGIDYDPASNSWVLVSDDRSDVNPARFYTARLDYDAEKFSAVTLTDVNFFTQPDGTLYPNEAAAIQGLGENPDLETIRFDPVDHSIWYASEGRRKFGFQPFVRHATSEGRYLGALPVPAMFKTWPAREWGARDNLSFEGISFSPDGQSIWLGMEAPLYQDGPLATADNGAYTRITHMQRDGKVLAQFAYPIDPIPVKAAPGKLSDNGASEILAIDSRHLYVLERSGVQEVDGQFQYRSRLYEIDVASASDIQHVDALQGQSFKPAKKRLVLDLSELPLATVGNLEGITWGSKLPNGNDTLLMVTDDNFKREEVTQFLLFEVIRN